MTSSRSVKLTTKTFFLKQAQALPMKLRSLHQMDINQWRTLINWFVGNYSEGDSKVVSYQSTCNNLQDLKLWLMGIKFRTQVKVSNFYWEKKIQARIKGKVDAFLFFLEFAPFSRVYAYIYIKKSATWSHSQVKLINYYIVRVTWVLSNLI